MAYYDKYKPIMDCLRTPQQSRNRQTPPEAPYGENSQENWMMFGDTTADDLAYMQDNTWMLNNEEKSENEEEVAFQAATYLENLNLYSIPLSEEIPTAGKGEHVAKSQNLVPENSFMPEEEHIVEEPATVPQQVPQTRHDPLQRVAKKPIQKTTPPGRYTKTEQKSGAPVVRRPNSRGNQEVPRTHGEVDDYKKEKNQKALKRHRSNKKKYLENAPGEILLKKGLKEQLKGKLLHLESLLNELHMVPTMKEHFVPQL